ncbi:MAG: restriction endonuclease subunit S, partial [Pseudomonadales bacterium]
VIAEAVTKGLDKTAAMKPSGVAVLGEVPAHWEVKKIRYVLDAIGDVDHFMPESVDKGVPYLMTGDLKDLVSEVNLDDCKQVAYKDYLALSKRIKSTKGDVVMARYATIGTAMYVDMDIDFLVSYSCVTLKPNQSNISGLYLFQYMKSDAFLHGVENQINTNTQGNVGISDLQNVMIAVPPPPEQKAISDYLDTETTKIDDLIAHTHDEIGLLKELRAATIADAVLGRIDVRGTSKTIAACA